jgi:hypothetical protein
MAAEEITIVEFLKELDACPEAVEWAPPFRTLEEMWAACPHAEWLIWFLEQIRYQDEAGLRVVATTCARHHWHLLTDPRSRHAVETAERFAMRGASNEELRQARNAAHAASETPGPQSSAASAAAATAAYNTTRALAYIAARDASRFGIKAASWDQTTPFTPENEDAWQADQIRRILAPNVRLIADYAYKKKREVEESRANAALATR